MKQRYTGIETTPTGVTNAKGIINGNWSQFELVVNPVHDDHTNTGINWDVANAVRNRVYGDGSETLTGATPDIDFDTATVKKYENMNSATTFTFSNMGFGKFVTLILNTFEKQETVTWPSSTSLTWLAAAPTTIGGVQWAMTSITSNGATLTGTTSLTHDFLTGETIRIRNSDVSAYNGEWVLTGVGGTTFTANTVLNFPAATTADADRQPEPQTVVRLWCIGNSAGTLALGEVDEEDK